MPDMADLHDGGGVTFSLDGADVVVVGAGTARMTAALVLADAGAAVTLLERGTELAAGAGVLLQPGGLAVLDALELSDPLRTAGRRMPTMTIRSARGTALLPAGVPHAGAGPHGLLATSRGRLHEILLDAIGRRRAIVARFGADVSAADPTGAVDLRWHDLVSTIAADLVIGADGRHSVVRGGGDFAVRTRPAGGPYLCGLLNGNDVDLAGEYWTSLGTFGGAQVDTATTSFYADASAPSVATAVADRDLTALADAWAAALPLAGEVMHRVDRFDRFHIDRPVRVDCARWSAWPGPARRCRTRDGPRLRAGRHQRHRGRRAESWVFELAACLSTHRGPCPIHRAPTARAAPGPRSCRPVDRAGPGTEPRAAPRPRHRAAGGRPVLQPPISG